MRPAPPAHKRTLIRRATYDLIGLPPTPEDVAAFVADESDRDAFVPVRVVDRLLASRHYGERWGRHWLDVARYASSDSPYAFTYRDYVIRSFNDDLPYDQFLLQQLAADQLDLGENRQALAALGFLTCGRQFENNIHDTIDDRIDVVTRGTMAALRRLCALPRPQVRSDTHTRLLRPSRCLRQLRGAGGAARARYCPRSKSVRGLFVEAQAAPARSGMTSFTSKRLTTQAAPPAHSPVPAPESRPGQAGRARRRRVRIE